MIFGPAFALPVLRFAAFAISLFSIGVQAGT
jgi:hypothetical protein